MIQDKGHERIEPQLGSTSNVKHNNKTMCYGNVYWLIWVRQCGDCSPTVMLMELLGGELSSCEGKPPLILYRQL